MSFKSLSITIILIVIKHERSWTIESNGHRKRKVLILFVFDRHRGGKRKGEVVSKTFGFNNIIKMKGSWTEIFIRNIFT